MIASAAITTGLFVLAGVVVGGLVTGSVNYVYEWRRESASARVAVRLLEAELAVAAAFVESRPEYGKWSTLMDFGTPQRSWTDYRAELARVLSTDEWEAVAVGFVGISVIERRFSERPSGSPFVADDMSVLQHTAKSFYRGINTLRKRQGIEAMTPGMKT